MKINRRRLGRILVIIYFSVTGLLLTLIFTVGIVISIVGIFGPGKDDVALFYGSRYAVGQVSTSSFLLY